MLAPQIVMNMQRKSSQSPRADSQTKLSHFISNKSSSSCRGMRYSQNADEDVDYELSNEDNSEGAK